MRHPDDSSSPVKSILESTAPAVWIGVIQSKRRCSMSHDETPLPGSIADRAVLAAISRRKFVGGAAGIIGGFAATGFFNRAGAAPLQQFGLANYLAQTLPDDAAAADQQTFVVPADPSIPKVLDFY